MSDRPLKPIGDVLHGIELPALPEQALPVGTVVLVKYLDQDDGEICWAIRTTDGVGEVEVIGALYVQLEHRRAEFQGGWTRDEDDL